MAHNYYDKLKVKAHACMNCCPCDKRLPIKVELQTRMKKIDAYFGK